MPGEDLYKHFDIPLLKSSRAILFSARSGHHYYLDTAPGNDIRLFRAGTGIWS